MAEYDHHAFSYFDAQKILAFPVTRTNANYQSDVFMEVVRIDTQDGFTKLGSIAHDTRVDRAIRIGDELWSIGYEAIKIVELEDPAHNLATLTF